MRRILFVDDEPLVLEGLENLLRRYPREWDVVFVTSAEAALAALQAGTFDVIVSDLRMPRMDGAELLRLAQQRHPCTVRIVLSGLTDQEFARRVVHTAHQFLAKPCDGQLLRETIERSCNLNSFLLDETLRGTIGQIGQLPAVPAVLAELNRALLDPKCSLKAVAAVVEQDPALCAKILQLVNSSFFGLARRVTDIGSAVSYLGIDVLKGLAMMVEVSRQTPSSSACKPLSLDEVHTHSLLTARIARQIARDTSVEEDSFVAGMLHDVGILILAARLPEELAAVLQQSGAGDRPLSIVEAVAFHKEPAQVSHSSFDLLGVVHVADALAPEVCPVTFEPQRAGDARIDREYLKALGVADRIPRWQQAVGEMVARH